MSLLRLPSSDLLSSRTNNIALILGDYDLNSADEIGPRKDAYGPGTPLDQELRCPNAAPGVSSKNTC